MIPVVFSALAMESVGKAAMEMVQEVRRQFREIPGIMEGTGTPEYAKCVDISTKAALREMIMPGLLTIITPISCWFIQLVLNHLAAIWLELVFQVLCGLSSKTMPVELGITLKNHLKLV